jgi:hypothetical protein
MVRHRVAAAQPVREEPALPVTNDRVVCDVMEKQVTFATHGHILTNIGVWSPDGRRIVYDTRSDPAGNSFDGTRIETVDVETGAVCVLYESTRGAKCGVATFHPRENKVVFIHGPEDPTYDWQYGPAHRQGVLVEEAKPGRALALDARDLVPPFTAGALRGGSHVHVFSPDGQRVSFTYEDHILSQDLVEKNQRNVGVCVPRSVVVPRSHPRNHDGTYFSALVTRTVAHPRPGSDEINKAFEESWIGTSGYVKPDGSRQQRALAFQGQVVDPQGNTLSEVFVVDIPQDITVPGDGPLEGTEALRPQPPLGTVQRRLTYTANRRYPGIQGPRHWLRSSPDGTRIAFLMRDDRGIVQFWTVAPTGSYLEQLTWNAFDVASAFSWSPDGQWIAHVMDNRVCGTSVFRGLTNCLTLRTPDEAAPRPEACVYSPDGRRIAFVRPDANGCNQIHVVTIY